MPRTRNKVMHKEELNDLQKRTFKQYGNCQCTRCGNNRVVSDQVNTYYKGVKVRIMLCAECVPVIVTRALDTAIEGHDRENLIDNLTRFGQV